MDIQQLRYFISAGKTCSFTQTASEFSVTRQAVSSAIQKLEAEWGIPLFDRVDNRIILTDQGKALMGRVSHIVRMFDQLARPSEEEGAPFLTLGIDSVLVNPLTTVVDLVNEYRKDPGGCDVVVSQYFYDGINQNIFDGRCDLCIMRTLQGGVIMGEKEVFRRRYLAITVGENHPFATRDSVDISEIKGGFFVVHNFENERYLGTEIGNRLVELGSKTVVHADEQNLYMETLRNRNAFSIGSVGVQGKKEYHKGCVALPLTGLKNNLVEDAFVYGPNSVWKSQIHHFIDFLLDEERWNRLGLSR